MGRPNRNTAPPSPPFSASKKPSCIWMMLWHTDRPIPIFRRVSDRMMAGFSPEELEQLAQFQRRMLDNLNSNEKE